MLRSRVLVLCNPIPVPGLYSSQVHDSYVYPSWYKTSCQIAKRGVYPRAFQPNGGWEYHAPGRCLRISQPASCCIHDALERRPQDVQSTHAPSLLSGMPLGPAEPWRRRYFPSLVATTWGGICLPRFYRKIFRPYPPFWP